VLLSKKYLTALDVVIKYHNGNLRKDKKTPYVTHPLIVMHLVYEMGIKDEDILVASLLHDLLEDSHITESEIKNTFNKKVLDLVKELTVDKDPTWDLKTKTAKKIESIKNLSKEAAIIKFADMLHNNTHLVMQIKQTPEIEKYFKSGFKHKAKLERARLEQLKKHHTHIKQIDELEKVVVELEKLV